MKSTLPPSGFSVLSALGQYKNVLVAILALLLPTGWAAADPAYPLKIAPGQHFIVDQNGKPFFIQGDSPWYLSECLNASNVDFYLSNRWAQGYNSVLLDITAQAGEDGLNDDTNIYGQHPFTGQLAGPYTNLLTWNVHYFTNVDYVISRANYYGICVFAYPLYDGYGGVNWYTQMTGNPKTNLWQFGAFIGARYASYSNIVWLGAGDYDEPNAPAGCLWNYVAQGIASADKNHLMTAQPVRQTAATYYSAFVTLNASYPACFPYEQSLANYKASPTLASFLREPYYAGPFATCGLAQCSDQNERQFCYWAAFSGESGYFTSAAIYGYFPNVFGISGGWQTNLVCNASVCMPNLGRLMVSRNWTNFVPDASHTVVTSGYGTSGSIDYITTERESHGYTIVSYIPQDRMTPTVAMNQIAGSTANAWWYNPNNGAATSIGNYPTSGTRTFTPPSTNDWVLVLDDAAQNYPAPGPTNSMSTPALTWANPSAITYGAALSSSQLNATASVPGSFAYNPTNGTVLNTGTNLLSVIFTPTDTVDYSSVTDVVSLVVSRASLTVTAANATRAYGQANPTFTGTMTGQQNGDNISATYSCSATTGSPVGTYPIIPALVDPANRQTNYTVSLINGALTITTAGESVTWANPAPITYGAALSPSQLNATASVPGSFAYNPTNGTVLNTGTNLLSVIFTPTDTVDYSSVTDVVSLVVSRASLTVTAANATRSYGQANPTFTGTMTGRQSGDNITATYTCSANGSSPVGTYPIIPALVDPANRQTNYTVSLINGALTVTTAGESVTWANPAPITYGAALSSSQLNATASVPGSFAYNPTNGTVLNTGTNLLSVIFTPTDTVDYSSVTDVVSLVVSRASLTVTAANATRSYGQANPTFTGTMTGRQSGDNITATYTCSANGSSPVGTYPIIPALVDPANRQTNYTVSLINGALTVTTAGESVTWANPAPITYGAALSSSQLNATASVPGSFAYNPTNGTVLNTGTNLLSVIFTPTDTVDYSSVTDVVSLVVSRASLTVTAANATRAYGQANPAFTGTITGVQHGDNITASYTCSANSSSPVGTYPIVPALVDPANRQTNYTVSLINGALTVTTAGESVTWASPAPITYGAALSSSQLNATASAPGSFAYNPTNGTVLNTGTNLLSVIFTPTDTVDYSSVTDVVSLVVSRASLTVTAANATRAYGQANPAFTGTITGVQHGDNITASYTCSANSSSPVGTYPIVPALVDPANRQTNYTVSLINGALTVTTTGEAGPAYPLKIAPGQHYVVDQNGKPFFIQGDSPWYISECLDASNVDFYLSNRWAQGYNSVLLDITAQAGEDGLNDDTNIYGQHPFSGQWAGTYTNLLAWNPRYFTNVDYVISRANYYGLCVFAYPLYDGYAAEGWYTQMAGNPTTNLWQFGAFLGARYANYSNIVWIGAGDYDEPNAPANCLWNYIAQGIASADTAHLITAQGSRATAATYYSAFVTLNASHAACFPYEQSLANYQASPTLASFLVEPYYWGPYATCGLAQCSDQNERQFCYWATFSGDAGYFFSAAIYNYFAGSGGWQSNLTNTISTCLPNMGKLMASRNWPDFVPDASHTVVTGGYGTSGSIDYITSERESHGYTVVAYIPQDTMSPTVAMDQIAGSTANAWWYNPSNGVSTFIGQYATSGSQTFTPTSSNDWVLVLDDAAQNYPAPGQTNNSVSLINGTLTITQHRARQALEITSGSGTLGIQALGGDMFQLNVAGIPGQTYTIQFTTNLTAPWRTLQSGTTGASGAISLKVESASSTGFYRFLQ